MPSRRTDRTEKAGSIRVLYVDDEPDFAALAGQFLTRESDIFTVVTEERAAAGLDRLEEGDIDCIVSDYDMPEMDGLDFLVAVRERNPSLPFILVTGRGSEELASEAISVGVTDYLQKRGGREQYTILANRIKNAVAQHAAEREAAHHRRVSELVRDVTRALAGATSREEIEQAVCDRVAESEPYRFAWIGESDPETGHIVPRTTSGHDDGYLDTVTITVDGPESCGPGGTALRENRVAVAQNVGDDPSFSQWREAALERGFHSVAGVPLAYDGTVHGVLLLYAAYANAFDETERALVAELGDAVGHALEGIAVRERLERQYQDLFELAPVMYILTSEQEGLPIITDCNQRVLNRLGYDRDEVVGSCLADIYTEESARVLLDEGGYERALSGEFTCEERRLVASDGAVVETLLRAVPRYDTVGQTVGTVTLFLDVTERRRARDIATQAAAMDASMDGMAVFDDEGVYRYVNESHGRIYGYDPDELVGESWQKLYDDDEAERLERDVIPPLAAGESWQGEAVGRRADGSRFPQELSLSPLGDGRFVCVVRDSTDRAMAKRELERQNDRLDEFASVVSHDLRGPLNVATGNLELARRDVEHPEVLDRLDTADRALDRIGNLIEDVLSIARGADGVETTVVSLERIVAECWQDEDEHVTVVSDVRFLADRGRLLRLCENLFRNAVEHGTNGHESVELVVGPLVDRDGFFVEDDGPGIPSRAREAVFEPGYTTSTTGTGLGLDIVRRIADEHDWVCQVTAGRDGGARFEFTGVDVVEEAAASLPDSE